MGWSVIGIILLFFFAISVIIGLFILINVYQNKNQSKKKKTILSLIGILLVSVPYIVVQINKKKQSKEGLEYCGQFISLDSLNSDTLIIQSNYEFIYKSKCSDLVIEGEWEFDYDNYPTFYFSPDQTEEFRAVFSSNGTSFQFNRKLGCSNSFQTFRKTLQ